MAWEHIAGNSSGPMNGDGSRKLTIHSTEGGSIESAVAAYRANNSWPTLTVDCRARRVCRHLTDTVGARSLQNTPGGADQTNRDGDVHIQVEVVGRAADPSSFGTPADMAWLGREVIGPLCRRNHIPIVTTVRWIAYRTTPPSSYGRANGVRLSPAEWDVYSGVLGHMHVPDNVHGDPGAFPIQAVLAAARGDDDMTKAELLEALKSGPIRDELVEIVKGAGLNALRPHEKEGDERGAWRGQMADIVGDELAKLTAPPAG